MRPLPILIAVVVLMAGWQYRADIHLPPIGQSSVSRGHVGSADAAARWLESSAGQGVRRAHCDASSAHMPAPPDISMTVSAGRVAFAIYDCQAAVAGHPVHAWCVVALQYQNPAYPREVIWSAGYATCRTIARADVNRFG